jgi:predicted transcriptional regulator
MHGAEEGRVSAVVARVTVTLPEDLLSRLDCIAKVESLTRSDVVREAAAAYVTKHEAGLVAREREAGVASGVAWLEGIAARPRDDARPSLEALHELRTDSLAAGELIEPGGERRRP